MKRFGDRIHGTMEKLWKDNSTIDSRAISNAVERAQKKVESYHFEARKHVTEYDDVMNKQRKAIYELRYSVLKNEQISETINDYIDDIIEDLVLSNCPEGNKAKWEIETLSKSLQQIFNFEFNLDQNNQQELFDSVREQAKNHLVDLEDKINSSLNNAKNQFEQNEKDIMLAPAIKFDFKYATLKQNTLLEYIDHYWNNHLQEMDYLREGIGLRGYGQKNPLHEYQREGYKLFTLMLNNLKHSVIKRVFYTTEDEITQIIQNLELMQLRREEFEKQVAFNSKQEDEEENHNPVSEKNKRDKQRRARRKRKK